MAELRAVFFDFGGTLVDYGDFMASLRATLPQTLARFGVTGDPDELVSQFGAGIGMVAARLTVQPFYLHRDLFRQGFQQGLMNLGYAPSEADLDWLMQRELDRLAGVRLRVGAIETLTSLRERGLHVGIVSNVDDDQFGVMLAACGLAPCVDSVLTSEAARSCKPDAGIYRAALAQAGCRPEEAVFVGDTPQHDIAGAHRAGMRTVLITDAVTLGIDRSLPLEGDGRPDAVISELPELLSVLDAADFDRASDHLALVARR